MRLFVIIAGAASIASLLISVVTLFKVMGLEKRITPRGPRGSSGLQQDISARTISSSELFQAGRNITE